MTPKQIQALAKEGKTIVVEAFSKSCPACMSSNKSFSKLEREFGKNGVVFAALDVDKYDEEGDRLKIKYMPTTLIVENNRIKKRFVGAVNKSKEEKIRRWLKRRKK